MISDKDLLAELKKYSKDFDSDWSNGFAYICLKIFFNFNDEDIYPILENLESNDLGVDAFWIDHDNKEINIAQFKSTNKTGKKSESARREWVSDFAQVTDRLLNKDITDNYKNDRIKDIGLEYRSLTNNDYSTNLHFFYNGRYNEQLVNDLKSISFRGIDDIANKWEEYSSLLNPTDPSECTINVENIDTSYSNIIKHNLTRSYDTYVAVLSGTEIVRLRREHKFQLFDRNVRYYLGEKNIVNKEIIETARNEPKKFFAFNNGITITCSGCRPKQKTETVKLILDFPQIINGAQTVNSIYRAYEIHLKELSATNKKDIAKDITDKHFDDLKVLCRIIKSTKGEDTEFASKLTRFNNSQNTVKPVDFRANGIEQREIQEQFAKLGFFYERKRGERDCFKNNEKHETLKMKKNDFEFFDIKINLGQLASCYQAYLGKPSQKEVSEKSILSADNNGTYNRLFGSKKSDIDKEKVKDMLLAFNILSLVENEGKIYNKCLKSLNKVKVNDGEIDKFRNLIGEITFLPTSLKDAISLLNTKELKNHDHDLIQRLYTYRLITQGKYMLTALIHEILKKNDLKEGLIEEKLFLNREFLKDNIIKKWTHKLIKKILFKVRSQEKNERSDNAFFLDNKTYPRLLERLEDLTYEDEEFNLKQEFKLELS